MSKLNTSDKVNQLKNESKSLWSRAITANSDWPDKVHYIITLKMI